MQILPFALPRVQVAMGKQPVDDTALVIECMDLLSKRLCGCVSAVLPVEDHEVFLDGVELILEGLEVNRVIRATERAHS